MALRAIAIGYRNNVFCAEMLSAHASDRRVFNIFRMPSIGAKTKPCTEAGTGRAEFSGRHQFGATSSRSQWVYKPQTCSFCFRPSADFSLQSSKACAEETHMDKIRQARHDTNNHSWNVLYSHRYKFNWQTWTMVPATVTVVRLCAPSVIASQFSLFHL